MVFGMYFLLKTHYNPRIIDLYPKGIKMFECGFFKNVRKQSGFTLLELLVVIAVIGVLASLAVPRFQNQIKKAKFVELVNAAAPYKTAVEICVQRGNALADCTSSSNGVPAESGQSASGVITSTSVYGGVITVKGTSVVDSAQYQLTPMEDSATGGVSWSQTGTCLKINNLCEPTSAVAVSAAAKVAP